MKPWWLDLISPLPAILTSLLIWNLQVMNPKRRKGLNPQNTTTTTRNNKKKKNFVLLLPTWLQVQRFLTSPVPSTLHVVDPTPLRPLLQVDGCGYVVLGWYAHGESVSWRWFSISVQNSNFNSISVALKTLVVHALLSRLIYPSHHRVGIFTFEIFYDRAQVKEIKNGKNRCNFELDGCCCRLHQ